MGMMMLRRRMMSKKKDSFEFVDLGLPSGTLWAACNVGADKPTDVGLFFSWGNIDGHVATPFDGYSFTLANYNSSPGASVGTEIPLSQDSAYVNMGKEWQMPSYADFVELDANCTHAYTTIDGVNGMLFTSKNNGNTLFFPAAGIKNGNNYISNEYGYYYKRDIVSNGNRFVFSSSLYALNLATSKEFGCSIRAIKRI